MTKEEFTRVAEMISLRSGMMGGMSPFPFGTAERTGECA
jgi:hypothetical protein